MNQTDKESVRGLVNSILLDPRNKALWELYLSLCKARPLSTALETCPDLKEDRWPLFYHSFIGITLREAMGFRERVEFMLIFSHQARKQLFTLHPNGVSKFVYICQQEYNVCSPQPTKLIPNRDYSSVILWEAFSQFLGDERFSGSPRDSLDLITERMLFRLPGEFHAPLLARAKKVDLSELEITLLRNVVGYHKDLHRNFSVAPPVINYSLHKIIQFSIIVRMIDEAFVNANQPEGQQ